MAATPLAPGAQLRLVMRETTVVLVLLTLAYYLLPLGEHVNEPGAVGRAGGSLVALALLAVVFRRQVRHSRAVLGPDLQRVLWLLSALYLLVLGFALGYALLVAVSPDQMVGVDDRTDALYFSATVVSTVGLGDVHPAGQAGRLLAICQMVFDVVYLGAALRLLTGGLPPKVDR